MFVLGHLGIGQAMARPWLKRLPLAAFFVGTLTPDLIDKPLYYGLCWITHRHGLELGPISGTRTFGHTLLLTLAVAAVGRWRQSGIMLAIALGMSTHLALDVLNDFLGVWAGLPHDPTSIPGYAAVFWPLLGVQFPVAPFAGLSEHVERLFNPVVMGGEAVGGALLVWNAWRWRTARRGVTAPSSAPRDSPS